MVTPPVTHADLLRLPPDERADFFRSMSRRAANELLYTWPFWARPNQLLPGDRWFDGRGEARSGEWRTWLLLAGRGFGKTRSGAEAVRHWAENWRAWAPTARQAKIALVARTAADARDVMVEGESGLLAIAPPSMRPKYEPSKRRLTWPNGATATTFSADEPAALRGPQHGKAWADELAAWEYQETWDQLAFGLRLGSCPQVVVTTTPRPTPIIKELMSDATVCVTKGSTYDNRGNLAPSFISAMIKRYAGTRLGRQELDAEILDDNPLALWRRSQIENLRCDPSEVPSLQRIVVGVDPQVADPDASEDEQGQLAETGIVVVGGIGLPHDPRLWVLEDVSLTASPAGWAGAAVDAYINRLADRIVAEQNNGGALVEFTVRTVARDRGVNVSYSGVHASRGKHVRAEPVAALYEQGRVKHVGCFPELEDQMCEWTPGMKSPDRMDALVWACTELALSEGSAFLDPKLMEFFSKRAKS